MINLDWVKDYIDIDSEDLKELAVKITKAGVNIEKVITNDIPNLVIGKVLSCINHPDSDHLHICNVDIGSEVLQIVCGAPNVRENLKVIVAKVGSILPGNFEIRKSTIRGVESSGMLCALCELGLEEKTEENLKKGIYELDINAPVGENPIKYLKLDDTLYEVDIHKHRNNDCYYHIGFAYEIASILNKKVTLPLVNHNEIKDDVNNYINVDVKTNKCPLYLAKMVTNITIKESPDFIKKRLLSVGMRPINNVVDISNYVMLEFGQPLHFFDKDKLGSNILIRNSNYNEKLITLDSKERILNDSDIVITDGKKPICIAGVMGGENTEIDNNTKNILIESAIFDGISIRNTSSRLNLRSEASIRYGKGLNYEYTYLAIERACHLLEKYADATILSGVVSHDVIDKNPKIVEFTSSEVNKLLGIEITNSNMEIELDRLGFDYKLVNDKFCVTIPNRRLDIEPNVNDIAEEIGRLYGYHNLVGTLPRVPLKRGEYIGDVKYRKIISHRLRNLGLNETKTYTLVSPDMAKIFKYDNKESLLLPNPMSIDKSVIRTSIIPSLLNIYEYNKLRKVDNINLYEIAKTYDINYTEESKIALLLSGNYITNNWQHNNMKVDFYVIKGIVENILDYLGYKNRYEIKPELNDGLHPGVSASIYLDREKVGIIGRVHPIINKDEIYVSEISLNKLMKDVKGLKFKPASIYPNIVKDMAFIVKKEINASEIINYIKKVGGRLLTSIDIFDVYTGNNIDNNSKSIAFKLTYSDNTRTLTEEEVTNNFNNIIKEVENRFDAVLRDK